VLGSAALHAGWNWLIADARDSHAITAVAMVTGAVVFAPVAILTWDVDAAAWPYIAASAALELAYFVLLASAYERADLTFVYPIARGAAPVLVLIVSVAVLGAALSFGEAAGVLAITAGVLMVRGIGRGAARNGLPIALAVAACIAGYTLVDDEGIRHAAALGYF
jgi:multidrug transporter EmrE-like cation transporter